MSYDKPNHASLWPRGAFTLVEMVIVIMVIAALTALALPKFRGSVEYSRSMEAFVQMGSIRQALDRCHFMAGGSYVNCDVLQLDINNPNEDGKAHFSYTLSDLGQEVYTITALRNTKDNGDGESTIILERDTTTVKRSGTGVFENIK